MQVKLQIFAIAASGVLLLIVFELLRRRRLIERYALMWLATAVVLLGLAVWTNLLEIISKALGIAYPPNALFLIAFAFVLLLLLHFSIAISRLSNETKLLAQEQARLDSELRELREQQSHPEAHPEAAGQGSSELVSRSEP